MLAPGELLKDPKHEPTAQLSCSFQKLFLEGTSPHIKRIWDTAGKEFICLQLVSALCLGPKETPCLRQHLFTDVNWQTLQDISNYFPKQRFTLICFSI